MTTDPAYVDEQTGTLIDAFMTEDSLADLLPAAKAATCTDTL